MTEPSPVPAVLSAYPAPLAGARWEALGSAGGFSGSRVCRLTAADGRAFALKCYPPGAAAEHLARVHRWMDVARSAGLDFVPAVERDRDGRTVGSFGGRLWDLTAWMPGRADFHQSPSDARLLAAVTAVGRVHDAWRPAFPAERMPAPGVNRRWRALDEWEQLVGSGWWPRPRPADPVWPHAEAAWAVLPALGRRARVALAPWRARPVVVQPCLCDVWHDHVLFDGDRVTGVIDFAAAKVDSVAVDLARLLGSLIPDDADRMEVALRAYSVGRPDPLPDLVWVLDWTGTVAAGMNWLRWLYREGREVDRPAVAGRLAGLVGRLHGFGP